ncbi:TolB family protein [Catenuloplanes atrovinosus]|uniref:Tol biopolymer transport system component n=1 Tax=Catenuloplanes atrovinosus TaxID=137266 RepID=A0AAE3YRI2_9ACTN|nr:hypothetical protein [Catenuloplanes atrovinosus]MDR7277128.1 Tol biopolymer transport system component [Catenuloplanes atrovinosus]
MRASLWVAGATAVLLVVAPGVAVAAPGVPELISVVDGGGGAAGSSVEPSISADGRFVAFESAAGDLVPGDTNGVRDVFLRDRVLGTTVLVSAAWDGSDNPDGASSPAISGDGRFVAFDSYAENLVPGDVNGEADVFVYDRLTGTTVLASLTSGGAQANRNSYTPSLSADGRYVAFSTHASNLLTSHRNGTRLPDVVVRDLLLGTTTQVSLDPNGLGGTGTHLNPQVSADGRYITFISSSRDLVGDATYGYGVFIRDMSSGITTRAARTSTGSPAVGIFEYTISPDTRYLTFETDASGVVPGDVNGVPDVFFRDLRTGVTELISVADDGTQGDAESRDPSVGLSGRCVVWASGATTLVPGDTNASYDIFVRDRVAGTTTRLTGNGYGGYGYSPRLTPDGATVVFETAAALTADDTNGDYDVYAMDPGCR